MCCRIIIYFNYFSIFFSFTAIGLSSNLAQFAQTYMYNFDDNKYKDYVCILSVLAQCAIDNAKRTFDINIVDEIERIKQDMNIEQNGVPAFWKHVKDYKAKLGDKRFDSAKINRDLICPMNYLMNLEVENAPTIITWPYENKKSVANRNIKIVRF